MTVEFTSEADQDYALDHTCDLCGATQSDSIADTTADVLAPASAARCRIVLCADCRLMYASPQLSQAALDTLYAESFDGDAGSRFRAGSGFPEEERIRSEEKRARKWGIKIIRRCMEIKGKHILDLRCRTGALSAALVADGAHVLSVDPFEANIRYAQQVRGLSHVHLVPFSRFHQLALPAQGQYDAVIALTEHLLAHVLSPRMLLTNILTCLKPGGYLFLDEKDVLRPVRCQTRSVFDSGPAHLYQFTIHTTAHYLRAVGFELMECEIDSRRVSSQRHIRAIARKPVLEAASVRAAPSLADGPTAEEIRRRLLWLERTWWVSRATFVAQRTIRRLLRRFRSRRSVVAEC